MEFTYHIFAVWIYSFFLQLQRKSMSNDGRNNISVSKINLLFKRSQPFPTVGENTSRNKSWLISGLPFQLFGLNSVEE
jgi:hypothetical protein